MYSCCLSFLLVTKLTTIKVKRDNGKATKTLFQSIGLFNAPSHITVARPPIIIEESAPAAVALFQKNAANKDGVIVAPYIVYEYICNSRTLGKNLPSI